jgi:diguanylate cyclase (GGDEF)-like protein/PAS domain S-box-containing protein
VTGRPSTRAFLGVLLITAAAWSVGSAIGNVTAQNSSGLASLYLPIGLAVAILLRVRAGALWWAVVAGILVGAAGTTVVTDAALGPVLLASSANAVQAVVIAWLLLRLSAERFDRPRDVASLAIAGVIGCAIGAVLGAAATWLTSGADPTSTASTWFSADLVAVVLVVPAATVIRLPRRLHPWMLGYVGLLALTILAAVAATTETYTANTPFLVFLARYALGILLLTVGFLYGTVGLGLIQIPAVMAGFAALADAEPESWHTRQAIIIVLALTLLAAALAVRRELAQRAAAEALTEGLFTDSPVATARITRTRIGSGPATADGPPRLVVDRANAAWCVLLGLDPAHANDTDLLRSVHPDDADDVRDLIDRADPAQPTHRDVRLIRRGSDRTLLVRLTSVAMANSGDGRSELGAILVAEDITERREAEERLNRQARTDGLTGLLNRSSVTEVLEAGLAATRDGADPLSTLFVDLDGFKAVNDNHGHATGDLVLKEVAARLLDAVRPRDAVGRYGGDEFLIVATGLSSESAAQALVERIHQALAPPMPVLGHDIVIGASIGIAVAQHGDTADTMLPRADADMYARKSSPRA